jgi:hypothetical protein
VSIASVGAAGIALLIGKAAARITIVRSARGHWINSASHISVGMHNIAQGAVGNGPIVGGINNQAIRKAERRPVVAVMRQSSKRSPAYEARQKGSNCTGRLLAAQRICRHFGLRMRHPNDGASLTLVTAWPRCGIMFDHAPFAGGVRQSA